MKKLIVKKLSKKIKKGFIFYTLGLILNKEKKSCTKIGALFNIAHDFLYRFLSKTDLLVTFFPGLMIEIANYFAIQKKGWLIIDDTSISKIFAKLLAGVCEIYDSALGRPTRGLCVVILAWSNGDITIPIGFDWYFQKSIVGEYYKTKSEVAENLILNCYKKVQFEFLLADAHYSTIYLLKFFKKNNIKYIGKMACNRRIQTDDGKSYLLKNYPNLKLSRNSRSKRIRASFHGIELYFSVHKRKNKNNEYNFIYIVSTILLSAKDYLIAYEKRWNIEMMFRTMKQSLGLTQCFSADLEKQKMHIFSVFFSYSFIEGEKKLLNLKNPEGSIKHLEQLKPRFRLSRINAFSGNFDHVA